MTHAFIACLNDFNQNCFSFILCFFYDLRKQDNDVGMMDSIWNTSFINYNKWSNDCDIYQFSMAIKLLLPKLCWYSKWNWKLIDVSIFSFTIILIPYTHKCITSIVLLIKNITLHKYTNTFKLIPRNIISFYFLDIRYVCMISNV